MSLGGLRHPPEKPRETAPCGIELDTSIPLHNSTTLEPKRCGVGVRSPYSESDRMDLNPSSAPDYLKNVLQFHPL